MDLRGCVSRLLTVALLSAPFQIALAVAPDTILMSNGDTLQGTVNGETFGVRTTYGTVTLPRSLVGAIHLEGGQEDVGTLMTTDGDRFTGHLLESVFNVTTGPGRGRNVNKDEVTEIQFAVVDRKQEAEEVPHEIEMKNTDVFRTRVATPVFTVETSYGEIALKREAIQRIEFKGDNRIFVKIWLKEDRRPFMGRLKNDDIVIRIATGQKLAADLGEIRRIIFDSILPHDTAAESAGTGKVYQDHLRDGAPAPEIIRIEAGCFTMGSPESEKERSEDEQQHEVCVEAFSIGKYEVTYAEYDKFAEATGRKKPNARKSLRGKYPVISVNWNDAMAYAEWLSAQTGSRYRLPTEAEWEYVARAGSSTAFPWGDDLGTGNANCKGCGDPGDGKGTAEVGSFGPNSWGLHDAAGNVWEWTCSNWTESYAGEEEVCADAVDSTYRVVRGGSWYSAPKFVRSAKRFKYLPGAPGSDVGFRLARD